MLRNSGKVIDKEDSLLKVAEEVYGSILALGNLRVNGSAATLDTNPNCGSFLPSTCHSSLPAFTHNRRPDWYSTNIFSREASSASATEDGTSSPLTS